MNLDAVETLLQTTNNSVGLPIAWPRDGTPEVIVLLIEMAPGEETGWHQHPVPLMGYIMEGTLTVYQSTGHKRVIPAGGVSLESVDMVHNGVNEGTTPCKMVVFVAGIKDLPFTEQAQPLS
jgi:quercetin dioxygenase-like cupin family protein